MDFIFFIITNLAIYLILTFTTLILGIVIHESGHLIFGLLSGYKFLSFRIAFFLWYKKDSKIKFSFSKSAVAGQCLLAPPEYKNGFYFTLYNLGGGIMNLIVAVIFLIPAIIFSKTDIPFFIFSITFIINILFAFTNLFPLVSGGIPNDGMNQKMAKKSKQAEYGLYLIFYINHQLSLRKSFKDFDETMFNFDDSLDLKNYLECFILLCKAEKLSSQNKIQECEDLLAKIDVDKLPLYYKSQVLASRVINNFIYLNNYEKAKEFYNYKKFNDYLKMNLPLNNLIKATYEFYINNDSSAAEKFLSIEKKIVNSYPNLGYQKMFKELINDFEKQMKIKGE